MDGLLVVDKPAGPTSHDVVVRLRRALGERRIGHTGTLDPMASGVLALVLGRATRLARFMAGDRKRYDAIVSLGVATDTYDAEGKPTGAAYAGPFPSVAALEQALESFRGSFLQHPPAYSAKKIGGRRSYDLARSLETHGQAQVVPAPVTVSVTQLTLTGYEDGNVRLTVDCSAGFYVRSLAHDLGQRLGTGAHLSGLRRTRCGAAWLDQARTLASIEDDPQSAIDGLVPMAGMLPSIPAVMLTASGATRATHGCSLGPADLVAESRGEGSPPPAGADRWWWPVDDDGAGSEPSDQGSALSAPNLQSARRVHYVRLLLSSGSLLGMAETTAGSGILHPCVVLM
jgi:tRNA pseudouridine55 synthase